MKKILIFDTETVGLPPFNFIYDIGWMVCDRHGNVYKRRNFLVREILTDGRKMMGAFFARKIFHFYIPAIERAEIPILSMAEIIDIMHDDLKECHTVAAYNIGFDLGALNNTGRCLNTPYDIDFSSFDVLCLWNFACKNLLNSRNYRRVADRFGWKSKAGNYKSNAECSYRYITGDTKFNESHTALDDCDIELAIMRAAFSRKKKIPYGEYNNNPWRIIQQGGNLFTYPLTNQLEMF